MKEEKITKEVLASGRVLLALKCSFLENRSKETLFPLLSCLRDSVVYVPVNLLISERDTVQLTSCKAGDYFKNQDEIRMKPDILESPDKKRWLPIFSQREQIPKEYVAGFSTVNLSVLRCLKLAHAQENMDGIVLDAFGDAVALPFEIADIISEIPSRLSQ